MIVHTSPRCGLRLAGEGGFKSSTTPRKTLVHRIYIHIERSGVCKSLLSDIYIHHERSAVCIRQKRLHAVEGAQTAQCQKISAGNGRVGVSGEAYCIGVVVFDNASRAAPKNRASGSRTRRIGAWVKKSGKVSVMGYSSWKKSRQYRRHSPLLLIEICRGWQGSGNRAGVDVLQPFDAHISTATVAEAAALVKGDGGMVGVVDAEDDFVTVREMRAQ